LHGDSVIVSARIRNIGFQPTSSFVVRLYDDVNADSIPQAQELVSTIIFPNALPALDSLLVPFSPFHPTRTEHLLIATASMSADDDTLNNGSLLRLLVGVPRNSIVINEIMYSPISEPEWVELYNTTADSVDVKGWKLSNRTTSTRYLVASTSLLVQPHGYAVLTKDTALLLQRYHHVDGMPVQVPSLPTFLFNNTGDAVVLFDQRDQQSDSIKYTTAWGGSNGMSLERIDALSESADSANWSSSVDSLRGTPGKENSVAALDHDLRMLQAANVVGTPHSTLVLQTTVRNIGRLPAGEFDIAFFHDRNKDSVASESELIQRLHVSQMLARRNTLQVQIQWQGPSGVHTVIAKAEYSPDLRSNNNNTIFTARIGYEQRSVVINEIMFAPFPNEAEYVEIANVTNTDIDLSGWKLLDRPGTTGSANEFSLSSQELLLHPGRLFVIASDSSIFSHFRHLDTVGLLKVMNQSSLGLNNDGDAVIIRDATGSTVDSVAYLPAWHNPNVTDKTGRSLEKIHPSLAPNDRRSWSTCVLGVGGTPGVANSIFTNALPRQANVSCLPNPFSPDGDGVEDFSLIHYELPTDVSTASLKIYDIKGRLIRYLVNNEPSGARQDVVWDGYDDERQKARVGIYIVLVEGLNEGGGSVYSAKGVVVLAAKL
jgi:hypothetical protein